MSKKGRRAHVKRAKHGCKFWSLKGSGASFVSTQWPVMLRYGYTKNRKTARHMRKLINRAHAIRGGYQS